ncbi:MAG: PIG-L family deacetylase [Vicinamibacterales bacterium]|nr:PIG-L family deacetylase [Vicinamibacterales bacterium]
MSSRLLFPVLVSLALLALVVPPQVSLDAQVRPVYSLGASGALQQIQKLRTTASALHTASHPDDEDTAFIARVARGDFGRVAYLSANRGEGGQNVIGPELFDALGVIRTEELLQARTLDGGEQFFTQTFDYGFSKTLAEAATTWGERDVLRDMVRVIRMYRPLVIYSRFGGTTADGHGHHQLSGKLTPLAYKAAADPTQFPEQIKEGLRPWQAKKLYRGAGFRQTSGTEITTRVDTGRFDPLIGRSYFEIAAEGRSQHKSQEMGVPESRGPQQSALILLDSTVKATIPETSVFDGLDTSLPGLAALAGLPAGALATELAAIDRAVLRAIDTFDPRNTASAVPHLADALTQIRAARSALTTSAAGADARAEADFLLAIKERDTVVALQKASGTVVDALSDVETMAAGESFGGTVRVFLAQPGLVKVSGISLRAPAGWQVVSAQAAQPDSSSMMARFFRETADHTAAFRLTVSSSELPTQPYWLTTPRDGAMYKWPAGAPAMMPFAAPLVTADVEAEIGGVRVTLAQPMQFRLVDQVRGELRRNVEVMPAVTVNLDSQLEIVPLVSLGQPRRIAVRLQNNALTAQTGTAALRVPSGWTVTPASVPFTLARKGDRTALAFTVTPAKTTAPGRYTIGAAATVGGATYDQGVRTLAYPHIQTHRMFSAAEAQVRVFDLKVAPVKVGYVMGSGDQVPDALRRMGLAVTELSDEALGGSDLSAFDTIVVGVRASEARPDFVANNGRLLDFVKNGGTLVVQYQQTDYAARGLAPFPVQMASRVTDQTAPVRILAPGHPVFTTPNTISEADFADWVQERNLYAFTTFDPQYTALLETADPGEPAQNGGQVYVKIGKGHFVYTAYAWFRQLPAGVPGAYRQFANLVSLGAAR